MVRQTISTITATRMASEPLPSGIAPYTSSNSFKLQSSNTKPKAKSWDRWLSDECHRRGDSTLKASARTINSLTTISLGTARPASQYFPWESLDIRALDIGEPRRTNGTGPTALRSCTRGEQAYDLAIALNYGYAAGSPQLLRFITEHVELIHQPLYDDWESCLTCGTTSAIEIVFRMLCNNGDWILTEKYTYSGAIDATKALGLNIYGVEMDRIGILPEDLDSKLRTWDNSMGLKPRVLYTIPSGQNPTGATQTTERRHAIYRVAEEHDLIIIEDDPYYYIQLAESVCDTMTAEYTQMQSDRYLDRLPPSYLSLDSSGRVLRLDTTSKILAPGLRCGWMTGCAQLVRKFLNHTELSAVSPSGPSQVMLYKLLDETWGHNGLISWLGGLSSQYGQRLHTLIESCKRHLPDEICRWEAPTVGMFFWIQVDWQKHPTFRPGYCSQQGALTHHDIEDRIYIKARENGVMVSKGSWFAVDKDQTQNVHFRMTFAAAPHDALAKAIEIFADTLLEEFLLV
jgi:aromatic amino acid aminotransferase I / 2-aminoadipate transaminase